MAQLTCQNRCDGLRKNKIGYLPQQTIKVTRSLFVRHFYKKQAINLEAFII